MNTTKRHEYSIFSHSLGSHLSGHSLIAKLHEIKKAGFKSFELFQDDLDTFISSGEFASININSNLTPPDSPIRRVGVLDEVEIEETEKIEGEMVYGAHGLISVQDQKKELAAATFIGCLARELGLGITCLQPLRDFEGW